MDIVVSFLAVLELMKMGKITLMQDAPFSDMDIQVVGGEEGEGWGRRERVWGRM